MSTWRLHRCHASIAASRTWEGVAGPHFILLDGREAAASSFATGIIELVATSPEDESSLLFSAVVPVATTWLHLYNWLRIGPGFPLGVSYRVEFNGERIQDPYQLVQMSNGFFVQIFAAAPDLQSYVGIPTGKAKLVQGELTVNCVLAWPLTKDKYVGHPRISGNRSVFAYPLMDAPQQSADVGLISLTGRLANYTRLAEDVPPRGRSGKTQCYSILHLLSKVLQCLQRYSREEDAKNMHYCYNEHAI